MVVYTLQANMTRGEITPYARARVDSELYQGGLAGALNWVVLRYGGVTKCPGTIFMGERKYHDKLSRSIGFEFNRTQVYSIEAGDLYFRFWTPTGRVESPPGTPVEIVTPYLEADLPYIHVRQSGDVLYVWCRGYQQRVLTRLSETSWTLAKYVPQDGPYLDVNTTATTLTPASTGHITADMTDNTTPSGTASSTSGGANSFKLFDRDKTSDVEIAATSSGVVTYRFSGGAQKVADAYWLVSSPDEVSEGNMPNAWEFRGSNDGTNWTTLDSRSNQAGWNNSEVRYYEFNNVVPYEYYSFDFRGGNKDHTRFAEIAIHQAASDQTPFNLTASSTTGINGGAGFATTDVGRPIRLLGGDGRWRWAEIVARTSSTVVTIRLHDHALPDLSPLINWRLGAWSDFTGWPSTGAIWEDRLISARTPTDPLGVWGSVSADYDNYRASTPPVDDDSFSVRLTGGKLNDIGWLNEGRDVLGGTAGSLRAIGRNNPNAAVSPSNIRQRSETVTPSSRAEPVNVEDFILFMDYYEQRLYEAAYSDASDGYIAREVSTLNEHLFAIGVTKIVYLSHPHKIIVGMRTDGKLIFFGYDREQKVVGGTPVDFGGFVEDIEAMAGDVGTDLWLTVRRTVDGVTKRYCERLAEFWRRDFAVQDLPIYAACAATYQGAATGTITGLDHLEGETVGVLGDGRDLGDFVVSGGEVALTYDVTVEEAVVGLRMSARLETLRLSEIGSRDGSGFGRKVNVVHAYVDLLEAAGLDYGSTTVIDVMQFEDQAEEDPGAPVPLRTEIVPLNVDDSWSNKGVFVIETDKMYPATILAISLGIDGEP